MKPSDQIQSRRQWLNAATNGFGGLALTSMLAAPSQTNAAPRAVNPLAPRRPHHEPKAKAVIYLYMEGGPSAIDLFNPKPALDTWHGKDLPIKTPATVFNIGKKVMRSPFKFKRHGQCGAAVSEVLPHLATCVDDMTFIHSMHHEVSNHSSSCLMSHTGYPMTGKPSIGAWMTYGLGSESENLPGFVVLDCGMGPSAGAHSWGSGFLPASYQGTLFTKNDPPIDYIRAQEKNGDHQTKKLQLLNKLNKQARPRFGDDSRVDALIANYERAFAMQSAVPEVTDLSGESDATKSLYGMDSKNQPTALFGSRCLLARRLVERGVRFIEVFPPRNRGDRWDQHGKLEAGHRENCLNTDQPVAGLIHDLKQRGLLDQTIILWGGEFGRTPAAQGGTGRDHNPFGYTVWTAGGGFKPGLSHGQTDEFGYFAQQDKVHLHDLHATILHLMGIDHERLTYRFSGRDFRLTDVEGEVVQPIIT